MKCASCGQENAEEQKFCRYCGKPLAGGAAASGAVNTAETARATGAAASGTVNAAGTAGAATSGAVNAAAAASVPTPPKKAKTGLVIGIAAASVVVLVGALLFFLVLLPKMNEDGSAGRDRDRDRTAEAERDGDGRGTDVDAEVSGSGNDTGADGAASDTAAAGESGAEESAASGVLHLMIYSASRDEVLSDASVIVRGDNGYEEELHGGVIDLDGLATGSYRVSASADGHNAREVELTIDAGEEQTRTLALAPEIVSADDACVLLVWDGEQDLDLCGFNADIQEYVDCGHIKDSVESMILFGDHDADKGYELLYIHDISYEVVKSIYVTEVSPARDGESSAMERDGVHVYLYDKDGERLSLTADASRDTALWRPFYIYAGEVYPEEEYISDTSELAWLSFDEADQIVERDDAAGETASAGGTASGGTSSTGGAGSTGSTADAEWKRAMREAVEDMMQYYWEDVLETDVWENKTKAEYYAQSYFTLNYIDGDAIPEIYISPAASLPQGSCILYWMRASAQRYEIAWFDLVGYVPYKGRIFLHHGMHTPDVDYVLTFPEEEELGWCAYDSPGWYDGTDHSFGGESLEYRWNDEPVSEAEYTRRLAETLGGDTRGLDEGKHYTYDELISYLSR